MNTKRLTVLLMLTIALGVNAQVTPVTQMEKLNRGVVALPPSSGTGRFVSWRFLGTDDRLHTSFDLIRNGVVIKKDMTVTNYKDAGGTATSLYRVVTKVDGQAVDTTEAVQSWEKVYLKLPLDRPATGQAAGGTYVPNDCSVGDVDGDGEYEIFVKWDPSTAKDNSQGGITDNVYIDCYKLDGTKLWRIDLGRNIRAGAHYTQFMVYDFDGDGLAEMMCKTAPGSKDGLGNYVNQAATDEAIRKASNTKSWVNSDGRINGGQEYLTVFQGLTGMAVHTIAYNPNRNAESTLSEAEGTFNWGGSSKNDKGNYGNRGERYLAAVAALDGPEGHHSGIFCRGYYTYAYVWAVDFDGKQLIPRWLHRSDNTTGYSVTDYTSNPEGVKTSYSTKAATGQNGSRTLYGNGNHNMSIGDADGDGRDEIIWGSAALDDDGKLLYATGFGHGDAIHMGKMIPGKEGLQVFQVHEEKGNYAWDLHDAATGYVYYKGGPKGVDNGRGMAAQLSAKSQEWWFSSASERQQRSTVTGEVASAANGSVNFRMYWDGTTQDGLLDGSKLDKYKDTDASFSRLVTFSNLGPGSTCNGTKNTPCLLADILGDWREELVLYAQDDNETCLGIYSTNYTTSYIVPTLMHDHTYRMAVCWQNTAYNQPPHLGYNLAEEMLPKLVCEEKEMTVAVGQEMTFSATALNSKTLSLSLSILPDGTTKASNVPEGFTRTINYVAKTLVITGSPQMEGDYQFVVTMTGLGSEKVSDTIVVHATPQQTIALQGDVNADGCVDVADISATISFMAGVAKYENADVNGDGRVDVADISVIISLMANATKPED